MPPASAPSSAVSGPVGEATRARGRVARLRGVRTRILVGSVVLLSLALGSSVLITRQMLLVRVDERIEDELVQEVEELRELAQGTNPDTGEPFADDVDSIFRTSMDRNVPARDEAFYSFVGGRPSQYYSIDAPLGLLDDEGLAERLSTATEPLRIDTDTPDGPVRILSVPTVASDGAVLGTFVVAMYPGRELDEVDEVVRTLSLVIGVALAVTSLAAWLVAGRVLRPVRELTDAARAIDAGELGRRIQVGGHDELAVLGRTFNSMLDRIDGAFRSQRAFLDDVAHELRTPITIARGHLELLDVGEEPSPDTVQVVTEELDRMGRYVDDLLVVAKAAQPDFLQFSVVDVGEVVDMVVARARALGERDWVRGGTLDAGDELVIGDEGRLVQALLALATNAVQHTHDGDRIEMGAGLDGDTVRIWVRDTGPGVAPEERDRIFSRFSRGAASRSHRPGGTGLGLPIVAAIAEAHGGGVALDSQPGEGATFAVVVPRRPPDPEEEP
ncbi:MAG: HAMP domain-containing histidine kinase [Acidimicrobiia bacterium]|nr:HAMP domain-containing histidine kinase [Acidimicrobiia bacterium]